MVLKKQIPFSNRIIIYDECDASLINKLDSIGINGEGSAVNCYIGRRTTTLGRYLLGIEDPKIECDHKDRDFLNFQRNNLRLATRSQQNMNRDKNFNGTSEYKGVSWHKRHKYWQAQIKKNGRSKFIGVFHSEEDAAKAYDKEAIVLFGEFAVLNFPLVLQEIEREK